MNQMESKNKNNNSSNSLIFGRWPQTKTNLKVHLDVAVSYTQRHRHGRLSMREYLADARSTPGCGCPAAHQNFAKSSLLARLARNKDQGKW